MFTSTSLLCRTASTTGRVGFTLVELLVVISIIAILASVALGPLVNVINIAKHNATVQTGHEIGQVCMAYATDNTPNGNRYPAGASGMAIAQLLINGNYASDPDVFAIKSQTGYTAPTSSGTSITLTPQSVSWSFTCVATSTTGGITSAASDLTPLVFYNNGFGQAVMTTIQGGTGAPLSATYGPKAPFGVDGATVFYKGSNAAYLKAGLNGTVGQIADFVSANDTDSTVYQVAP